jgi:hypothetical protein
VKREFPYSQGAVSVKARVVVTGLLFLGAVFFLWRGDSSSIFEHHDMGFSDDQNLALNLFSSFFLLVLGFLSLFRAWGKKPDRLRSVVVSPDLIAAPNQGVSGRTVEIPIKNIAKLQKLSVDGVWEFNVQSLKKNIRVPKASLDSPDDFDRLISHVQKLTPNCTLEIEERIDPPMMNT